MKILFLNQNKSKQSGSYLRKLLSTLLTLTVLIWSALISYACKENKNLVKPDKNAKAPGHELFEQLVEGINLNFEFSPDDVQETYNIASGYLKAIKSAGFSCVRVFIGYLPNDGPQLFAPVVQSAIDNDLAINLCMIISGKGTDLNKYVKKWEAYADYYKNYPDNIVFELLNEPRLAGIPDNNIVLQWYNAVMPAIRKTNPTRTILIGGPQWNEPQWTDKYINSTYLTYKLCDGTGFEQDKNIMAAVHIYEPGKFTMPKGKDVFLSQFSTWKTDLTDRFDIMTKWSVKTGKHVVVTEWGAMNVTITDEDFLEFTKFMAEQIGKGKFEVCISVPMLWQVMPGTGASLTLNGAGIRMF